MAPTRGFLLPPVSSLVCEPPGLSLGARLLQLPPSPLRPACGPGATRRPSSRPVPEATHPLSCSRSLPLLSTGWDSALRSGTARRLGTGSVPGWPYLTEWVGGGGGGGCLNWGQAAPRGLPAPWTVPRGPNAVPASGVTLGDCVAVCEEARVSAKVTARRQRGARWGARWSLLGQRRRGPWTCPAELQRRPCPPGGSGGGRRPSAILWRPPGGAVGQLAGRAGGRSSWGTWKRPRESAKNNFARWLQCQQLRCQVWWGTGWHQQEKGNERPG